MKGTVSRDFIVFLPILTVRWYFLVQYFIVKSIKIGPLISHIFRITNHRSLFLLKTSIYIQIVIRWASIHRLSICIIDLPTTDWYHPWPPSLMAGQYLSFLLLLFQTWSRNCYSLRYHQARGNYNTVISSVKGRSNEAFFCQWFSIYIGSLAFSFSECESCFNLGL